jgi:type IV secretory pathway VirB2 component (pilin)
MGGGVVMRVAIAVLVIAGMTYMFGRFGFNSFFE